MTAFDADGPVGQKQNDIGWQLCSGLAQAEHTKKNAEHDADNNDNEHAKSPGLARNASLSTDQQRQKIVHVLPSNLA
ncbi:MAG: hypothetical protein MO846_04940 [Candidatus Devosia symbiotica]|nr:hypothetical protein [Candidatus Devosia symbiotica]